MVEYFGLQEMFFVTRAKTNMAYRVLQDNTDKDGNSVFILADQSVELTAQKASKDYKEKLRLVIYLDSKTG